MENNNQETTFSYSYSAKENEAVRKIREKYIPKEENKLEQLQTLDASVTSKATMKSLAVGIPSTLVVGVGMCCCMVWEGVWFIPGIIIGILGFAGVGLAYPVYNKSLKKERELIAPEVLRLSEELLKEA